MYLLLKIMDKNKELDSPPTPPFLRTLAHSFTLLSISFPHSLLILSLSLPQLSIPPFPFLSLGGNKELRTHKN